jgi:NAD(P)H-dependent FMN reductase
MELTITEIYGSVRTERQGIKAALFIQKELQKRGYKVNFIDPQKYSLPLLDYMYKEYKPEEAPESMRKISNQLNASDAFVLVTGEYNHGIPPALKNTLDHFQSEYLFKPNGIVSYSSGSFGGVRAAIQLRTVMGELGSVSISSMLPFPKVQDLFDEPGNIKNDQLLPGVKQFIDELEFYALALKEQRKKGLPF